MADLIAATLETQEWFNEVIDTLAPELDMDTGYYLYGILAFPLAVAPIILYEFVKHNVPGYDKNLTGYHFMVLIHPLIWLPVGFTFVLRFFI